MEPHWVYSQVVGLGNIEVSVSPMLISTVYSVTDKSVQKSKNLCIIKQHVPYSPDYEIRNYFGGHLIGLLPSSLPYPPH